MFDDYISSHGRRLFGLCQKLCANREDAEDLYQETWIKAYRFFGRYDGEKDFEAWLTSICVNTYRDLLRRQKWKSLFVQFGTNEEKDFALSAIAASEEPDFAEVREAVNGLPDKYRIVTVLYYFNGLDVAKTSEILKIPAGTVKYQLHEARKLLRGRLENDG
ncbi:MAG: sigma-70 family RNA polymerase sigma factor [Firmicutes bacterium]|nr:sigma-70 family RNA polymerase sigma factor [Bacillota bacterium]